jgi:hypothetical protein
MPLKDLNEKILVDEENIFIKNMVIWKNHFGRLCTTIKGKNYFIHHFVLQRKDGFDVDHIDGDMFNIRKSNLRYVTRSQNIFNRPKRKDSKQIYKGIQKLPSGKYRAKASNGKHIGTYYCPIIAYNEFINYSKTYYGKKFVLDCKNL